MSAEIQSRTSSPALEAFLAAATVIVGKDNVLVSERDCKLFSTDFSEIELEVASAVVRPQQTEHVVALVHASQEYGIELCARGGGMSYSLAYVPARPGAVIIDMRSMNRILDIDVADLRITVETGVTWKQIHDALRPTGYRIPFLGTFSGERATVGGGLGNNATGHGALDITDYLLGMEVVLPDGRLLQTGARAHDAAAPMVRGYGPDFTGVFTHDAGTLGIKTKASFRLVRRPAGTAYRAYGFLEEKQLIDAICATQRLGIATEIMSFGTYHHRVFATQPKPPSQEAMAFARAVMENAGSPVRGFRHMATLARGMEFLLNWPYSLTVMVDSASQRGAEDGARQIDRLISSAGGRKIRPSLGIVLRTQPFVPIGALMVGADGASSFPSNFTVPLSKAQQLVAEARAFFAENEAAMRNHGVYTATLFLSFKGAFGMEPIIYWPDRLNVLRYETALPHMREALGKLESHPEARAFAVDLRRRLVARLQGLRPAHYQTGKFYPYREALADHAGWDVINTFKRQIDPDGRLNPGALGL